MTERQGKVAVITGAARGQGRSHALRLAADGADIIAVDICADIESMDYSNASPEDLEETVRGVKKLGRRVVALRADVRDAEAINEAIDNGVAELGRLDIVLANAGIVRYLDHPTYLASQVWNDIIATNLSGAWNTVHAALPHILSGGRGGCVVLTGSTAGVRPVANTSVGSYAYTASKWGLVGLCRQLAATLAKDSIRVNVVHPTGVASGMTMNDAMQTFAAEAAAGGDNALAAMQNAMPIDILQPEDISDAISFLVSDRAKWITGVSLPVDAGFAIR